MAEEAATAAHVVGDTSSSRPQWPWQLRRTPQGDQSRGGGGARVERRALTTGASSTGEAAGTSGLSLALPRLARSAPPDADSLRFTEESKNPGFQTEDAADLAAGVPLAPGEFAAWQRWAGLVTLLGIWPFCAPFSSGSSLFVVSVPSAKYRSSGFSSSLLLNTGVRTATCGAIL